MTTCVSDLLQEGWDYLQANDLPQVRVFTRLRDENGVVVGACALGAVSLARELPEFFTNSPAWAEVCPDFDTPVTLPDGYTTKAYTAVTYLNDGYHLGALQSNYTAKTTRSGIKVWMMPIPDIIVWLKEQGL